ncbi:MAG: hypothetical protein AAB428_03115 [Patescibacteria group bacterium]
MNRDQFNDKLKAYEDREKFLKTSHKHLLESQNDGNHGNVVAEETGEGKEQN